jgi:multifunctional 2-oxoglutarate metabolism enzyme
MPESEPKLNINSWLEDELYQTYLHNRKSVDDSWKTVFESNGHAEPVRTSSNGAVATPGPGIKVSAPAVNPAAADQVTPMRGIAARIAENMTLSLTIPTATSQRLVQVRVLEENRQLLNQLRTITGKSKVSYTHLIGWALLRGLEEFPQLNDAYTEQNGEPVRLVRKQINFGLAVDVKARDGSSTLMVPCIKNAGSLTFTQYMAAFDDIVARARTSKLLPADFQGTTISLTNPGTVGTVGSVPRLVVGQGAIIATGAMDYPAEYASVSPETKSALGISKVMMVTCTYDHRIIQGAESGRFLGRVHALLNDGDFYKRIFKELGISLNPVTLETPQRPGSLPGAAPAASFQTADPWKEAGVAHLINAYRVRGHTIANIDPLGSTRPMHPDLDPATHGITLFDFDRRVVTEGNKLLRDVLEHLRETYSASIGPEYMYIPFPDQKDWLRDRMESTKNAWPLDNETRLRILDHLVEAEIFEQFLHTRFIGKKRFSVEGAESAIVFLDEIVERAANNGVRETIIGMAHRGRLNVLANIVGKPIHQVFSEFEEAPDSTANAFGSGDVKYHLGASHVRTSSEGREITVSVAFNPSHLEAVNPVVEGMVRGKQDRSGDTAREQIVPVLIHGDAAFAGQGVVFETLNLSQLEGYSTGGTIHLVINNQLGFTTNPDDGRSGDYSTDIAKAVVAPVFHVNGDDPEAVHRVAQLAFDFRQRFKRDVVVDIVCYRRYGHNEGDDPSYTQPQMYAKIKSQPSALTQYSQRLIREKLLTQADFEERRKRYTAALQEGYEITKRNADAYELQEVQSAGEQIPPGDTAVDRSLAESVITALTTVPADFNLHPKLKGLLDKRREAIDGGPVDWAFGEALAFGTLVAEGIPVRLSGQDSGRGTFSQRHLELFDVVDGRKYTPMQHIDRSQSPFEVWNSSLSEFAVMGFEFGFSLSDPNTLVLWEAQFGDFVNGAQIIIDQFLASAETKWGQASGLVLLLPHGYEGQGPEHSSARIERFLNLCAEHNMQVGNCTTPAQYFHMLRRHMLGEDEGKPVRKPLVLFTPKSMLRNPKAISHLDDFTSGRFYEILDDTAVQPESVKRILFCSGKVYYDILTARETRNVSDVAIVRTEQMYPFPQAQIEAVLARYPSSADVFWVQEEPRNMGPWRFMLEYLQPLLDPTKRTLFFAGRSEGASPSAGSSKRHEQEQADLVSDAFSARPVARKPRRVRAVPKQRK